jgi:hypothetical protein
MVAPGEPTISRGSAPTIAACCGTSSSAAPRESVEQSGPSAGLPDIGSLSEQQLAEPGRAIIGQGGIVALGRAEADQRSPAPMGHVVGSQ